MTMVKEQQSHSKRRQPSSPKSPKSRRRQEHEMRFLLMLIVVTTLLTKIKMTPPLDRVLQNINKSSQGGLFGGESYDDAAKVNGLTGTTEAAAPDKENNDCFSHPPIKINYTTNQKTFQEGILQLPTPKACGLLGRDWSRLPVQSDLANEFERHQTDCSLPVMSYQVDDSFGFGSHLVLWSQALCNAMEKGYRVRASNPHWLWMDKMYCDPEMAYLSPLLCYFPKSEMRCAHDEQKLANWNETVPDPRNRETFCTRLQRKNAHEGALQEFRSASVEYLFQHISPLVIKEAERQIGLLFGERAPPDLITVHLRWGDKFFEMDLASIAEYVAAINVILQKRGTEHNSTANIYLASEDPKAVKSFLEAAPATWKVVVDRTFTELTPYRPPKGNRASWTARNTKGRAGLVALGSLLVAMEANDFVFTTASNWSRMMDALRRNTIDPRCGNCTTAIDLRPGIW